MRYRIVYANGWCGGWWSWDDMLTVVADRDLSYAVELCGPMVAVEGRRWTDV